jgi:hypothetical protein
LRIIGIKKESGLFKNCNFGDRHENLNVERIHVKEYFENTVHIEGMTDEQITIFMTLTPIWKILV